MTKKVGFIKKIIGFKMIFKNKNFTRIKIRKSSIIGEIHTMFFFFAEVFFKRSYDQEKNRY